MACLVIKRDCYFPLRMGSPILICNYMLFKHRGECPWLLCSLLYHHNKCQHHWLSAFGFKVSILFTFTLTMKRVYPADSFICHSFAPFTVLPLMCLMDHGRKAVPLCVHVVCVCVWCVCVVPGSAPVTSTLWHWRATMMNALIEWSKDTPG